ncbi:MAG: hypothetical protein ACT4RN_06185 [Pseudonocardia sp.]
MKSATAIRTAAATVLLAVTWLLVVAAPAGASPDHDGDSGGCPPGGCVNVYEPEPTHSPDPPQNDGDGHGSGDSGGCCGGSDATHDPAPVTPPETVIVVPAQPLPAAPARPRAQPRPVAPPEGFVPADAAAPAGALDLTATSRGSGELLPPPTSAEVAPAAVSTPAGPADMPPWTLIAGGLVAAAAAAGLGATARRPQPVPTAPGYATTPGHGTAPAFGESTIPIPVGAAGPAGVAALAGFGGAVAGAPPWPAPHPAPAPAAELMDLAMDAVGVRDAVDAADLARQNTLASVNPVPAELPSEPPAAPSTGTIDLSSGPADLPAADAPADLPAAEPTAPAGSAAPAPPDTVAEPAAAAATAAQAPAADAPAAETPAETPAEQPTADQPTAAETTTSNGSAAQDTPSASDPAAPDQADAALDRQDMHGRGRNDQLRELMDEPLR